MTHQRHDYQGYCINIMRYADGALLGSYMTDPITLGVLVAQCRR